jgi:hypothetical protein
MKSNLISKNQNNENHSNNKYVRCSSVEEKINNPRFSHNLEKDFLDVKFIVKNSVEKINTLFNNKEFKQKTSKNIYNNISNKININRYDLNNTEKKDDKKDKDDTLKYLINASQNGKDKKLSKYSVKEEDEFIYNSNELFKELKDLNSNKSKNNNKFNNKYSLKTTKSIDLNSISGSLLNLESNKLYSKKEQNLNLKKINISESANLSKKNKDKKYINPFNYIKTESQNDVIGIKDKKKDKGILKYIQKGNNKNKKIQNNIDLRTRNINKPKVFSEKSTEEEINAFNNTQKIKKINNSSQNHIKTGKKNNSNSMLIDINYKINPDIDSLYKKENKANKIICSTSKNSNKREIMVASLEDIENQEFENIIKINKNTNIFNVKKVSEKIKTQDFMKMMLILNEYLIANNLLEDYSNSQNKKVLNDYSLFLLKNIKNNHINKNKNQKIINNSNNKIILAVIKIQRKWRKIKLEKYLINNFLEEGNELRKMLINNLMEKTKFENSNILDIFNCLINNCKLINNNVEDINKIFELIRKLIQRNLTINEENIIYKEYINEVIYKK